MGAVYRYITRPDAESGNMLIEFIDLPENKEFIKQLIHAFESIKVQLVNYSDLWIKDEIVVNASSDIGDFTIFRNAADYYFITSKNNTGIISQLDLLLSGNRMFKKI
jgi:hypothetical protein